MSRIFISYSRRSQDVAKNIVNDIQALGCAVWFDQDLSGGQAWWDQILAIIRDSDIFVFVLDADGLNSAACQREFGYAAALGKPVLPVLVADGLSTSLLPPELSRLQFIDYRNQDRKSAFALARAIAGIPPSGALPDPLPAPPEVPVSYLGGLTRKIETAPALSYEEQSALVLDLRRGLRDLNEADDTRVLLRRLRARRDLFAAMAEEIDELLGVTIPAAVPHAQATPKPPPEAPLPPHVETAEIASTDSGQARPVFVRTLGQSSLPRLKTLLISGAATLLALVGLYFLFRPAPLKKTAQPAPVVTGAQAATGATEAALPASTVPEPVDIEVVSAIFADPKKKDPKKGLLITIDIQPTPQDFDLRIDGQAVPYRQVPGGERGAVRYQAVVTEAAIIAAIRDPKGSADVPVAVVDHATQGMLGTTTYQLRTSILRMSEKKRGEELPKAQEQTRATGPPSSSPAAAPTWAHVPPPAIQPTGPPSSSAAAPAPDPKLQALSQKVADQEERLNQLKSQNGHTTVAQQVEIQHLKDDVAINQQAAANETAAAAARAEAARATAARGPAVTSSTKSAPIDWALYELWVRTISEQLDGCMKKKPKGVKNCLDLLRPKVSFLNEVAQLPKPGPWPQLKILADALSTSLPVRDEDLNLAFYANELREVANKLTAVAQ